MESWQQRIDEILEQRWESIVALRRQLHQYPEPSGEEQQTSMLLYQRLGDEGLDVRLGLDGCGVIADSPAKTDRERLGIRGDIDALRIHDEKQVEYRSCRDGVMHACGHDAHATIAYATLATLNQMQQAGELPWPVPIRGILQPAEETCTGARQMIEIGALEGVQSVIALHCDPSRPVGTIGLRKGVLTANCDAMRIEILGRGGHAARPHEANDPITAAMQLINAVYLFIPRAMDSQDAVVVTFGKVAGGDNPNVIPEKVTLEGTVRTLDQDVRQATFEHLRRIATEIGRVSGTQVTVEFGLGCHSVTNDPATVELFEQAASFALGAASVQKIARPSMGSEDFAYYLEARPGAMLRLGCRGPEKGSAALHTPVFDIDEDCLMVGARIMTRTAVLWASPYSDRSQRAGLPVGVEA